MADLEQEFQQAAKNIKDLKSRPTDKELLDIYGLYKQATDGDCNQEKPGMFYLKERAKHEAWNSRKGMSKDDAKEEYIALSKKIVAQYS